MIAVLPCFISEFAGTVTLERSCLTYSQFGAWVQKQTGSPVTVAKAIRDRKALVLCRDQTVQTVMDKFAEAFFLTWERTPSGLLLRLQDRVAAEEAQVSETFQRWFLQDAVSQFEEWGQLATVAPSTVTARRASPVPSEADRYRRFTSLDRATGELWRRLSVDDRQRVLSGQAYFGSDQSPWAVVTIDQTAADRIRMESHGSGTVFTSLRIHPIDGSWKRSVWTGNTGTRDDREGTNLRQALDAIKSTRLWARISAWAAVRDSEVLARKLSPENPALVHRVRGYASLPELLTSLHRRSGANIIADAYRQPVSADLGPDGPTVERWLRAFTDRKNEFLVQRTEFRSHDGWLFARNPLYWQRTRFEPSEASLLSLESAAKAPGGLTLNDWATFAAALKPEQIDAVQAKFLIADAPLESFRNNAYFFRLWASLTPFQRKQAQNGGTPLSITPEVRALLTEALENRGPLKSTSGLTLSLVAKKNLRVYQDSVPTREGSGLRAPEESRFDGFDAFVKNEAGETVCSYRIPLNPSK